VLAAARPGFRYLETSTISPELSRRIAEAFRDKEPMPWRPRHRLQARAERGTLLLMTGGRRETHEELMPVMMAMGQKAIYCGETGQGSVVKLIGNTYITFMLEALCETLVVAARPVFRSRRSSRS